MAGQCHSNSADRPRLVLSPDGELRFAPSWSGVNRVLPVGDGKGKGTLLGAPSLVLELPAVGCTQRREERPRVLIAAKCTPDQKGCLYIKWS